MLTTEDIETTYLSPPNVDVWAEIISFVRQPGEEHFLILSKMKTKIKRILISIIATLVLEAVAYDEFHGGIVYENVKYQEWYQHFAYISIAILTPIIVYNLQDE